eukprot:TRINITY_DN59769_c0_g1_i1.p1 TRINITY_DN59769_c0_g1~~TRINITY_DN59769_c0_g1_i1.p1  ORF type:complete len:1130 (+),score=170.20 TRINITY_DN59769_c0_g1_i1:194-3391(+)
MFPPVLLLRERSKRQWPYQRTVTNSDQPDRASSNALQTLSIRVEHFIAEISSPVGSISRPPLTAMSGCDATGDRDKEESDLGRDIPYNYAERFFGDIFAPKLSRCKFTIVVFGLLLATSCLMLIAFCMRPSNSAPAFFAPGTHNLADAPAHRSKFSATSVWTTDMEQKPLEICEGCSWEQDCRWGLWKDWGLCSATCTGQSVRFREVEVFAGPAGSACTGDSLETVSCNSQACLAPCPWAAWEPWSMCTGQCGTGLRTRTRTSLPAGRGVALSCSGPDSVQQMNCSLPVCKPDCKLTEWAAVGSCSATCGGGSQRMQRTVTSNSSASACVGELLEKFEHCGWSPCPDPCTYGMWEDDPNSTCSVSCGFGFRIQFRKLLFAPGGNESLCLVPADSAQRHTTVLCHLTECPVNMTAEVARQCSEAKLGIWTDWSSCADEDACAKNTTRTRHRSVPELCASYGVASAERSSCNSSSVCAAECQAVVWVPAGSCSTSCGLGKRREIADPSLGHWPGIACPRERHIDCFVPCPVDCSLGEWTVGGSCSVRCEGKGTYTLVRNVLRRGYNGGQPCPHVNSPERRKEAICDRSRVICPSNAAALARAWPSALSPGINQNLSDAEVATVSIVFGLRGRPSSQQLPRGEDLFDPDFDFGTSSAQAAVWRLCQAVERESARLAVRRTECLLDDLVPYLKHSGSFPYSPPDQIHARMVDFFKIRKFEQLWKNYVGFEDVGEPPRVRWLQLRFVTDVPWDVPAKISGHWHNVWEGFVSERNALEAGTAGVGKIFHSSHLWVRFDFESRLVQSALLSSSSSVLFALLAVLLFLGNAAMAVYIILVNVCSIICLAGTMFGVLGWEFGAVEAVALIVVVGLSVDYSLHLAEAYLQSQCGESRYLRAQDAVRRTGAALVGAAATSVLSCPPILLCTVQVFVRFGTVIIISMVLSLFFSLFVFTSVLMLVGPVDGFGSCASLFEMLRVGFSWCCCCLCRSGSSAETEPEEITIGTVIAAGAKESPKSEYTWKSYDDGWSSVCKEKKGLDQPGTPKSCCSSTPSLMSLPASASGVRSLGRSAW